MEKKATLLSGIAGSGKSTWAEYYVKNNINTVIISTDAIRYELFKSYQLDRDQEKIVQRTIMDRVADCAKQGLDIIIDIAVVKNKNRIKWFNKLRPYFKQIELVYLDIPLSVCLENNKNRDRHVPEYVIKFMDSIRELPNEEVNKLFTKITIIKDYSYRKD